MRFFVGFALLFAGIAFIHGLPIGSQLPNVNTILSQLSQYQGFLGQLDNILPQLNGVLSSTQLQSLKDKLLQLVLSQAGSKPDLDALKDQILPLLQQFLGSKPQGRVNIDSILQEITNAAATALPSIILSILGKRDINQLVSLADKFQLTSLIPQVTQFLSADKLQQLQNQLFSTVVAGLGNNWNLASISQAIQQLVTQFVPQIAQMRIDWDAIGQAALEGVVNVLPSILIGAISLFGKRDLSDEGRDLSQIINLANQFQLTSLIPQVTQFLSADKLQQLQNQLFSTVVAGLGNNWNLASISQAIQQLVTQFVPQIAQMRIDWEAIGQAALDGVVSALPSLLIGAISLFGKRALDFNWQQLLSQLPINQIAQIFQLVSGSDKTQVLSKLTQLLQQFFPNLRGTVNFDELAANILNNLNNLLPILSQGIFGNIFG